MDSGTYTAFLHNTPPGTKLLSRSVPESKINDQEFLQSVAQELYEKWLDLSHGEPLVEVRTGIDWSKMTGVAVHYDFDVVKPLQQ